MTIPAAAPAGSENRSTRSKNPGSFTRWVGARARKNPGRPMEKVPIRVSWRGRKGKGDPISPIRAVSSTA